MICLATYRHSIIRRGHVLAAALAMLMMSALARAQVVVSVAIRVHVVDSAHTPITNADVAVVHGLNDVLAAGTTDRNGVLLLRPSAREENYQIVVRKLGYTRASKFLLVDQSDSLNVDVTLSRATLRLDTVKVVAEVNKTRERTFIDADAIAASDRPLFDAIDVVEKLRPAMTVEPQGCTKISALWVNGVRVAYKTPGSVIRAGPGGGTPPLARPKQAIRGAPPDAILALSSIKPEHIASIDYRNCFDKTVTAVGGQSALFVILKDGIAFRLGVGSYVISAVEQDSILKAITRH